MTDPQISQEPFVSVVTPVYNGASNLAECIESVLQQSYQNFEFVLLNNASTDDSAAIMADYAAGDERIRIEHNESVLPIMENWNHALSLSSATAKYCKVVHADDLLLSGCLKKMVAVAEKYPQATLIGAYRINGSKVDMDSIPFPDDLVSGRELARGRLLTRKYRDQFGAPTSVMYRADCVRNAENFYDPTNFHADTQSCFELLNQGDYAFVHEVLSYTRRHEESQTSATGSLDSHAIGHLKIQHKMAPLFLTEHEQQYAMNRRLRFHYRRLVKDFKYLRNKEFRKYHREGFADIGQSVNALRLSYAVLMEVLDKLRSLMRKKG